MNLIRAMVDIKLSVEDINEINELTVRDEALPVVQDETDPGKWCYCPKCKALAHIGDNFCKKCGQRLDTENFAL